MSEIVMTELTQEEILKAIGESVAERDEIFDGIDPQNPKYLTRLKRDLRNWEIAKKEENIGDFLRWREAQGL